MNGWWCEDNKTFGIKKTSLSEIEKEAKKKLNKERWERERNKEKIGGEMRLKKKTRSNFQKNIVRKKLSFRETRYNVLLLFAEKRKSQIEKKKNKIK